MWMLLLPYLFHGFKEKKENNVEDRMPLILRLSNKLFLQCLTKPPDVFPSRKCV